MELQLFGLAVSSAVTIPTASSCFCFHVSNTLGICLDCFDGRIPHGPICTMEEIRKRDPSVLVFARRWLRNRWPARAGSQNPYRASNLFISLAQPSFPQQTYDAVPPCKCSCVYCNATAARFHSCFASQSCLIQFTAWRTAVLRHYAWYPAVPSGNRLDNTRLDQDHPLCVLRSALLVIQRVWYSDKATGQKRRWIVVPFLAGVNDFSLVQSVQLGPKVHPSSPSVLNGTLSLSIKRPIREVDHSSPSNAEVNNALSFKPTSSWWAGIVHSV